MNRDYNLRLVWPIYMVTCVALQMINATMCVYIGVMESVMQTIIDCIFVRNAILRLVLRKRLVSLCSVELY